MDEIYIVYDIFGDGSIDLRHVCISEERAKQVAKDEDLSYEAMDIKK